MALIFVMNNQCIYYAFSITVPNFSVFLGERLRHTHSKDAPQNHCSNTS